MKTIYIVSAFAVCFLLKFLFNSSSYNIKSQVWTYFAAIFMEFALASISVSIFQRCQLNIDLQQELFQMDVAQFKPMVVGIFSSTSAPSSSGGKQMDS